MLETLLLIAIAVIGVQAIVITLLINLVNKSREEKKQERTQARNFIRSLIKLNTELQRDANDYKDGYYECYAEFKALFKENKVLKKQLGEVNKMHGDVVNNLIVCIKEGRVIKSKYMDNLIPYKFENMTLDEISQFFGTKIG